MKKEDFIVWFKDIGKEDIPLVGGKCANLGELYGRIGVPVPNGFAVTSVAYRAFLDQADAGADIYGQLRDVDTSDIASLERVSGLVREKIERMPVPDGVGKAILRAYSELCRVSGRRTVPVAVRSSATAEDLPGASFAGQQDTYLNVRRADLVTHVRRCWASLFTPRAIAYRVEKGFSHEDVFISVAVQELISSAVSGVLFTIDPVSGRRDRIVIDSSWGLGEAIVSGQVTPDEFVVDKKRLTIEERIIANKRRQIVSDGRRGTKWQVVAEGQADKPSLSDEDVLRLARYAVQIENHYGVPQDIEWAIDKEGSIFILQARPETVHGAGEIRATKSGGTVMDGEILIRGIGVSPGKGMGTVRTLLNVKDIAGFKAGEVLVTEMTTPDWVPAMKKAAAIVTNSGGKTCHAAIVSRELGIPCVVGTEKATEVLDNGQPVTVDGQRGIVYAGVAREQQASSPPIAVSAAPPHVVTGTKVYVNVSMPEIARRVAGETGADGVGLMRAEHMMLGIGKHPRLLIEEGGEESMVEAFSKGIAEVAESFYPRPLVYRFLDFKPDEFLELPGGDKYERPHVGPNPMIGYRGEFRYVKEDDIFRLELRAIRRAREVMGFTNIWVMVPFVRTLDIFRKTVEIMVAEGLDHRKDSSFQLWIMVEVPSACLMIEEFCREGIDGVSFGTNDLTMLVLGVDRNDQSVQEIYDERNLAVLRAIAYTITVCRKFGVTTSICGQAPSVYPDYLEFMIRCGCTSISVNPDVVLSSRRMVAAIEQKIQTEMALGVTVVPKIAKIPMERMFFWRGVEDPL